MALVWQSVFPESRMITDFFTRERIPAPVCALARNDGVDCIVALKVKKAFVSAVSECYTGDEVMEVDEKSMILVVDDDPDIRNVLTLLLRDSYQVSAAADGFEAVRWVEAHPETDLVVLDVMMPGMDGFETCDRIRALSNVPILFLTAKSAEADRLSAYRSGGDDFLSKPFSQGEFLAKVSSLLRRYKQYLGKPASALAIEGLEVDLAGRSVKSGGREVSLTDTEFSILEHLLKNRGKTVTAADLYEAVWGERFLQGSGNTVMVHVLNLRRKIEENPSNPRIIRTVWGKGYQID